MPMNKTPLNIAGLGGGIIIMKGDSSSEGGLGEGT